MQQSGTSLPLREDGPTPGLMVIFGAGASYDSIVIDENGALRKAFDDMSDYRPPLATELFKPREAFRVVRRKYVTTAGLLDELQTLSETVPIETAVEAMMARAERNGAVRRELWAMRFYVRSILTSCAANWPQMALGATNYARLLRDLYAWREDQQPKPDLFFVTFNYDQMIEETLPTAIGGSIGSMGDYIGHPIWKLFKPHGSVTWLRAAEGIPNEGTSEDSAVLRVLDAASVKELELGRWVIRTGGENVKDAMDILVPVMVMPMQQKPFVFPEQHQAVLVDCIRRTRWLLLVGWKMTELNLLKLLVAGLKDARIQVVSRNATRANALLEIAKGLLPGQASYLAARSEGFGPFARSGEWKDLVQP